MHTKRIMKFGGSSLADADCFRRVSDIIRNNLSLNPMVVVSALGSEAECPKITDLLLDAGRKALENRDYSREIMTVSRRYQSVIGDLGLDAGLYDRLEDKLNETLRKILNREFLNEGHALDMAAGLGEIFSAEVMAVFLSGIGLDYEYADVFEYRLVTDENFGDAGILESSYNQIAQKIISSRRLLVFPGFVGCTADGDLTTLGRGGSDYTAAVIGAALKRDVDIWTDVDGIYTIDPKYLPGQFRAVGHPMTIPCLSYEEAFQMAAFGSRVLHEKTLLAVQQSVKKGKHIHLTIKNTFNPEHRGTLITSQRDHSGSPRGITCLEGTQLFNLYPDSYAQSRVFTGESEKTEGANIVLASETWGRLSLVFDKYHPGLSDLESRYPGHLSRDQVLVKIVGDGLGENPKTLSKIHNALQSAENQEKFGMTVVHKSPQLLTDNTFEFLVKKRGISHILTALYKDIFMEDIITVGLLGMGTVGGGVIKYTKEMYSASKSRFRFNFPSVLVRDTRRKREIDFEGSLTDDPDTILDNPLVDIVLEVMGGIEPARSYILKALKNGKHVVTANKALLAEHGCEIFAAADRYARNLGFEASVCAEIPIIDDFLKFPGLADIKSIQGIVNGTSNYILTRFMEGMTYEDALGLAQQKGFAEADPAMDVEGIDAAQKLSILASILFNQPVDYRRIPRQGIGGLLPADCRAFERWGYVIKPLVSAGIVGEKLQTAVGPALITPRHPLSSVREENNALSLYLLGRDEPIIKIGKGAGAIPTARSVVRDLLDVARKSRSYMIDVPGFFKSDYIRDFAGDELFESSWYARVTTDDRIGVFGKIASIIGDFNLSIRRVLQEEVPEESGAHVIFELKNSTRENLNRAVDVMTRLPFVRDFYHCMILEK